jgi:starch phosphorylase
MNILGQVTVLPRLPDAIARLDELAHNLFWTWEPRARKLFRTLDPDLWERVGHNPVALLRDVAQHDLEAAAGDGAYLASYREVLGLFDGYMNGPSWFDREIGADHRYAYFCAEYGWHEAVALYSGGLGVLAGDHTKAASDLGVPLVAVGLWYPEGYFHQQVGPDGQQVAYYDRRRPVDLPFEPVLGSDGAPVRVTVPVFGHEVSVGAWSVSAGRVKVYLLDVDLPENRPEDRELLQRLYGGDQRTRISQEIVLGIGGVRMLRALGVSPTSWHMNEGHSAFMALERCRELVAGGLRFEEAREAVAAATVFTVHTPVAAGNDAFSYDLINQSFGGYWGSLGLRQHEFHDLGRADHGWGPVFSMPALALRFTSGRNGVARLHGETSRRIWSDLWPEVPVEEVPIGHVTNGVHAATWVAPEIQELVASVLPDDWLERLDDAEMWQAVRGLDRAELWRVREGLKARSVRFLRRRVRRQLDRHEASPTAMHDIGELFDPSALTIGFARRFATYKRATLIFRDLERLETLLADPERPVQLVFAGKAHPADLPGQALISHIQNLSQEPRFRGRVLFVEDYDMAVGRALTRGVDVWLNNPRRPLEASGTSGQKAAMNGILNLSVLDGWWPEGFDGVNGWAIGGERTFGDDERADAADADALYTLLEREVVPLFYQRDDADIPQGWLDRSVAAIESVSPRFNAQRMVKDYVRGYYAPAAERGAVMNADDHAAARDLAAWRDRIEQTWPSVKLSAEALDDTVRRIGDALSIEAQLDRGSVEAELIVEVVYARAEAGLDAASYRVVMERVEPEAEDESGLIRYRTTFRPEVSGKLVYGVRVYPRQALLPSPFDANAVRWA